MLRGELEQRIAKLRDHNKEGAADAQIDELATKLQAIDFAIAEIRYGTPEMVAAAAASIGSIESGIQSRSEAITRDAALQIGVLFAEMVSEAYFAARAELDRQWEAWSGRQDALAAEIATETGNWLSEDEQRAYEERRRELAGRIEEAEDPVEQALLRVELAGGDVEQMRRILEEARANGASPAGIQRLQNAIYAYNNQNPKPFVWTKSADDIIIRVNRGKALLETLH